jgi:hypothetical protein
MNRPAASSEAHVDVAHQLWNVPVLSWTWIHCIPSTKSRRNDRSTTSEPTSSLLSIHLAPAPSIVMVMRSAPVTHREIDLARPEEQQEGQVSISCCHQLQDAIVKVIADVGWELMHIYLPEHRSHHGRQALTLPTKWWNEVPLSRPTTVAAREGRGDQLLGWWRWKGGAAVATCLLDREEFFVGVSKMIGNNLFMLCLCRIFCTIWIMFRL